MSIPPRSGRSNVVDIRITILDTLFLLPRPAFTPLPSSLRRPRQSLTNTGPPNHKNLETGGKIGCKGTV